MRIASLLPSATEIVFALGAQDELVGVTFECDFPAEARQGRAILVGGLDTAGLDAAAIDELVRSKVAAGQELYTLDDAAVHRLQPDVVLTQDLCRVCALPAGAVDAALDRLGCDAAVITLDPHTLDDVLATVEAVGDAIGRRAEAAALLAGLRARLDAVAAAVADRRRPSVFVLEWPDPPFVAGHWVPELVERAGGRAVLARAGQRSVETTWEQVSAAAPEVVVVASCGYDLDATAAHAEQVAHRFPSGVAVWAVDANAVMVRPGPRLVDGVEALAALLHGGRPSPALVRRIG
ncbi:MAG: ABC transporter substrate-binding protein [Acidimicrobiales bacterium]